jgi:hypothetical protein
MTGLEPTRRRGSFTVRFRTAITTEPSPVTTCEGGVKLQPGANVHAVGPEESKVAPHEMSRSLMVVLDARATGSKLLVTA